MDWRALGLSTLAGLAVVVLLRSGAAAVQAMRTGAWRRTCERLMRWSVRERYALGLQHANLPDWHVTDLWLLHWVCAVLSGAMPLLFRAHLIWALVGALVGWFLVSAWLAQRIKRQQRLLTIELPAFLDLLSMSLCAGMNLQTGVQLVLGLQTDTAIASLWRSWLLQVRSGTSRVDAFRQMLSRVKSEALRRICVALIQAEQTGGAMAATLQAHSHQLRQERLLEAERQALKAPVKMLLPLVVCFFPSTFLVLGFSIYLSIGDLL